MPDIPNLAGNVSRVTRTSEKIWLPAWRDRNDVAITNSAKQLPVKPYYECFTVGVYRLTVVKALTDAEYRDQLDSLNSTAWRGVWPQYSAWISEIHCGGLTQVGANANVENIDYVIRCIKRSGGWRFQHPDVGYLYKDGSDYKSFADEPGAPPIGKLDGSGDKLAMNADMIISFADVKTEINFTTALGY